MQVEPRYDDVVAEIHAYLEGRRDARLAAGIAMDRICLDPGIGFGKTHAHNLELMARAGEFLDLGVPILVGHSRKGFHGKSLELALGRPARHAEPDGGTAGSSCSLAAAGIQIIRVHAVGLVRAALELHADTAAIPRSRVGLG
ncbi:MAG: dihydropteroate synthase, partial [Planctomycetia bacterium]